MFRLYIYIYIYIPMYQYSIRTIAVGTNSNNGMYYVFLDNNLAMTYFIYENTKKKVIAKIHNSRLWEFRKIKCQHFQYFSFVLYV